MSLFEGLAANEGVGRVGRQDCRDCGVRDQVIPAAAVAIPESPFVPPKLPGGAPIVIVDPGPQIPPPMLPPVAPRPTPVDVQPPFDFMPVVEPPVEPTPRLPGVTNGDIYPTAPIPMVAPVGARNLPCC